ncbi:hypothetical protein SAMN02744783_05075 [Serratia sp. CC22-02]|nr:hypothetical protein SAMN02744783_05075 [Serratia sp. CC22-02]
MAYFAWIVITPWENKFACCVMMTLTYIIDTQC